jgi:hypothetical protein
LIALAVAGTEFIPSFHFGMGLKGGSPKKTLSVNASVILALLLN